MLCPLSGLDADTLRLSANNIDLDSMEPSYNLAEDIRIPRGVEILVSLSASNEIGSSNFSNVERITISQGNTSVYLNINELKYVCTNN